MRRELEELLQNVWTVAVACNQWGDTGKGKIVDMLAANWASIIVRCAGGANAGHTISINDKEYISHLIPSGILQDGNGKQNIIASGVALDLRVLLEEIGVLEKEGLSHDNLLISMNARLVLPQHVVLDRVRDISRGIGTTGRGIGPVYTDHPERITVSVNDLLNIDLFRTKLESNLRDKLTLLKAADRNILLKVIADLHFEDFYDEESVFNVEAIVATYYDYGQRIRGMIRDTEEIVRRSLRKERILLEGAQGLLLSVDHGSYPFVTSSDCSVGGMAKGAGIREIDVDMTFGVVKAFFMTRVGNGPFPTEIGGPVSAKYCREAPPGSKVTERLNNPEANVNETDVVRQGIAIRIAGGEYGATTGRPRRIGWEDLPLLRYAMQFNGKDIVLTKIDVLDDSAVIRICTEYRYVGPAYQFGDQHLQGGEKFFIAPMDPNVLENCEPIYRDFEGWQCQTKKCRTVESLPEKLREILIFIAEETDAKIRIISVGADREATIIVRG